MDKAPKSTNLIYENHRHSAYCNSNGWQSKWRSRRDRERRLPTLIWPREVPIEGEPADVVAIVDEVRDG